MFVKVGCCNYAFLAFLFPDFLVFRLQNFRAFFFVIDGLRRIVRRTHFENFFRASRHFVTTCSFDQSGCRFATFCWHCRRLWRRHNFRSVRDFNLSQCFTSHGGRTFESFLFLTTISWKQFKKSRWTKLDPILLKLKPLNVITCWCYQPLNEMTF